MAPRLDPDARSAGAPEDSTIDGSRAGIGAGGPYTVGLLSGLLLNSGNDTAQALARAMGGDAATVAAMTEKARRSVRSTPAGDAVRAGRAGQSTSAYDLALLFRAMGDRPVHRRRARPRRPRRSPEVTGRAFGYRSEPEPAVPATPATLGGKTGFTDAARHTFVDRRRAQRPPAGGERGARREPAGGAAARRPLLLDWGFAVPAGTAGRRPAGRRRPTWTAPAEPSRSAPRAAEPEEQAAVAPSGDDPSPLVGAGARGGRRRRRRRRRWWPAAGGAAGARRGPVAGRTGERVLAGDGPGAARRLLELGEGLDPELGREVGQPAVGQVEHVRARRGPRSRAGGTGRPAAGPAGPGGRRWRAARSCRCRGPRPRRPPRRPG